MNPQLRHDKVVADDCYLWRWRDVDFKCNISVFRVVGEDLRLFGTFCVKKGLNDASQWVRIP